MWPWLIQLLVVLAMAGSLVLLPFGLPGVWIMVAFAAIPLALGTVSLTTWVASCAVAGFAEVAELAIVKRMGDQAGGSPKAFWAAVAGGFLGLFVGLPVPLIGSVVTAFVGTFLGAGLMTLYETRSWASAGRVGWSVVLARTFAVGVKIAAGVVILAVTITAMVWS